MRAHGKPQDAARRPTGANSTSAPVEPSGEFSYQQKHYADGRASKRRVEISPRLLNREQAACYCGVSVNYFLAHVAPFLHVVSFGGSRLRRWDVQEIDRHLDALVEGPQGQHNLKTELAQTLEKFGNDLALKGRKAGPC